MRTVQPQAGAPSDSTALHSMLFPAEGKLAGTIWRSGTAPGLAAEARRADNTSPKILKTEALVTRTPFLMALLAALLFGAATPASKLLLDSLAPFQLAGLLYLGAALGVLPLMTRDGALIAPWRLDRPTLVRLLGAIGFGGVLGPVLLLFGLRLASAASVSLWLNLELVATALLGFLLFRDYLAARGWLATAGAFGAAALLSADEGAAGLTAGLLVSGACLSWGLDNHLTALIDGIPATHTTFWKGVVAGSVSLGVGLLAAPYGAGLPVTVGALVTGVLAYGASLVLYISAAQQLGATRSQIVFSSAPFFGLLLSALLLGESISTAQLIATLLFALSIGLLLSEHHAHPHRHDALSHTHWHLHGDGMHDHEPDTTLDVGHDHPHEHDPQRHDHPHWPDLHHRHDHDAPN